MPPHPQLTEAQAAQMVAYILGLGAPRSGVPSLPVRGAYTPTVPRDSTGQGVLVLRARYTDRGANGLPSVAAEQTVVLRAPTVVVASGEIAEGVQKFSDPQAPVEVTIGGRSGAHVGFRQLDLTGVGAVTFAALAPVEQLNAAGGKVEVRLDTPDGALLGETPELRPTEKLGAPAILRTPLRPTTGVHDVYFVFRNAQAPAGRSLLVLTTATFEHAGATRRGTR